MVFKKTFTLLVATKTIPFFVVVAIISDHRCSLPSIYTTRGYNKYIINRENQHCIPLVYIYIFSYQTKCNRSGCFLTFQKSKY